MTEVLWISHRGLKERHPENTAEAFRDACDAGFKALETDLRVSADGHVVLCHDVNLRRILGLDVIVSSLTRAQLESLRFPGGEPLLFLDQFAQQFSSCQWTLDIKPEHATSTFTAFKAFVGSLGSQQDLFARAKFLFWDRRTQEAWCREWPQMRCYGREPECYRAALCVRFGLRAFAGLKSGTTYALVDTWKGMRMMSRSIVESYHEAGAKVCGYLPETKEAARAALSAGVDEIITNHRIVV